MKCSAGVMVRRNQTGNTNMSNGLFSWKSRSVQKKTLCASFSVYCKKHTPSWWEENYGQSKKSKYKQKTLWGSLTVPTLLSENKTNTTNWFNSTMMRVLLRKEAPPRIGLQRFKMNSEWRVLFKITLIILVIKFQSSYLV